MKNQNYLTIRKTAAQYPISEYVLRRMHKEGKLPGMFSGNRFYVCVPELLKLITVVSE